MQLCDELRLTVPPCTRFRDCISLVSDRSLCNNKLLFSGFVATAEKLNRHDSVCSFHTFTFLSHVASL